MLMKTSSVSKAMLSSLWLLFLCPSFLLKGQDATTGKTHLYVTELEERAFNELHSGNDSLLFLMAYDSALDAKRYSQLKNELDEFVVRLYKRKNRFPSDIEFAKFLFTKTHDKYLKHYIKYVPFNELFYKGNFNCLSGTALYAYLFEQLGYQIKIFETRYHSFLIITKNGKYEALVEATDNENGFINGTDKIISRIEEYQNNESNINPPINSVPVDQYPHLNAIGIKELAGLHYFNLAVVHFNKLEYQEALFHLKKAHLLYPTSKRVTDMIAYALACSDEPHFSDSYSSEKK